MENGRIPKVARDVGYYGGDRNSLRRMCMSGLWRMGISIVFVRCMSCIVVSGAMCVFRVMMGGRGKRCFVYFYSAPLMDKMALFISIHTHACFILIVCHTHHFACCGWITGEDVNGY